MSSEPYISGSEVADRLGVSLSWVVKRSKTGEIPGVRLGANGPRRYRWSEIEGWLDATRNGQETPERTLGHSVV